MHAKTAISLCLLICLTLAAAPCSYSSDTNTTPARIADAGSSVNDDQFADDNSGGGPDDGSLSGNRFPDPIHGFNRPMYTFNDKMYYYVLKPTAKGLAFVLPEPSRICLKNFFYNLSMPIRALNCLFQGRGPDLGVELWRFIINSSAGVGGLFDPASSFFHLPTYKEDTGLTFGHYGAGPGFYLMIPVLGPSSGRDGTGTVFDIAMDPLTYVPIPGLRLFETVINTSLAPDEYDTIKTASLDPYIAIRDGYLEHREARISK